MADLAFHSWAYALVEAAASMVNANAARTTLQRVAEMQYNVLDFGAKRDNTTDDRPFIQEAVWCAIRNGGGYVYFPPGKNQNEKYKVNAPIVFTSLIATAADNGSGLFRLTGAEFNRFQSGDVLRTTRLPYGTGDFTISKINATTVDLQGSTFVVGTISAVEDNAGKARITVPAGHGVIGEMSVRITGATGWTGLNGTWNAIAVVGQPTKIDLNTLNFQSGYVANSGTMGMALNHATLDFPFTRKISLQGGAMSPDNAGSCLSANFADYVIKKEIGSAHLEGIYDLGIVNSNAGGGGIFITGVSLLEIRHCHVSARTVGINLAGSSYMVGVYHCNVIGVGNVGIGIACGQNQIIGNSITGWDIGLTNTNVGTVIIGNRFEVMNVAMRIGMDYLGVSSQAHGVLIAGNSSERCDTTLYCISCSGLVVAGNAFTGTVDPGGGSIDYGIRIQFAQNSVFIGSGTPSGATNGISINNGCNRLTFIGMTAVNWTLPSDGSCTFIGCNNPAYVIPFASLPASPVEGMEFNISNSTTATWGAIAAGGGINRVKVRYNGTNWTVVGI